MNQENKNNPGVVGVNNTSNVTPSNQVVSNPGESQMLAGSPGIRIAPVQEMPVDASNDNKVQVNNSVSFHNTSATVTSKAPVINPSAVVPRVEVTSALSSPPPPPVEEVVENTVVEPPKKRKGHGFLIFLLLLIIAGLGGYIYMDYQNDLARGECSPLVESDGSLRELDVNSTIVQELYEKVKTNIREDIAYHNFDDTFKLYLAYRQIPLSDFYDSNCNSFNESVMSNFSCASATNFTPRAFKVETLQREVRKLFGESVEIPNQNIVLGNSCFGGYQYIADRGEYVEGYCGEIPTTTYQVDKELISASVQGDTITLREQVRYYSADGISGSQLQNGVYVHTFKLDNHYHYAYVNRSIEGQ